MALPAFLVTLLKSQTTAAATTALAAEPARTLATAAELRQGVGATVRGLTPALLAGLASTSGTTASRPTDATVGFLYFDTTLNKPVFLKTQPSTWVDATGTAA